MTEIPTILVGECNLCRSGEQMEVGSGIDFEYASCDNLFRFVRCGNCGLVYLQNRPTPNTLGTIYGEHYIPHHFEQHLGGFISGLRRRVQTTKVKPLIERLPEQAAIMDVGPGNGEFLAILKAHGPPDWRLYGVDFAEEAVHAVEKVGAKGILTRFEDLEWRGPPINAVTMIQVIEHLEDPQAAIAKSFEVLSPGGVLFIETPSIDGWDYNLFKRRYWGGWHTPRHWHLFSEGTLSKMVEYQGFRVEHVTYLLSPNFWLQSVHHYLHDRWGMRRVADLFDVSVFPALAAASALDVVQKGLRGRTSNFRLTARKPLPG